MAKHAEDERTQKRRQKRRRRFLLRWAVVLVVLLLVMTLVRYWDKISPETLLEDIGTFFTGDSDSGYPVDVSGNRMYQMETADNCTAVLSDTYVALYNNSGNEVMRRTHAFAEPMLRTAGKYVLLVERGGRRLQLETRSKSVITHTTQYDIISATVHTNGNVAVITEAEQGYNARLTVYRKDGKMLYERLCSTLLSDVAFSPNGKNVAVSALGVDKGSLYSMVEVLSLQSSSSEPIYKYSGNDVLISRVAYLSNSLITAVGDTAVWMYRPQKEKCDIYTITDGEMKGFAISSNSVALVTQPYGSSGDGSFVYVKSNGTAAYTEQLQGVCRDVAAYKNTYAVLTETHMYRLGGKGITSTDEVPSDGKMIARIGDTVTVMGLQNITAY